MRFFNTAGPVRADLHYLIPPPARSSSCAATPTSTRVVPRELASAVQEKLIQETAWYVRADGGLDVVKLLATFQEFFRAHSEHWIERFQYREAGPQLLLQAFCQRIVNGGGRVEREYGLGRKRVDLLLLRPQGGRWRKFVVECKLLRDGLEATLRKGLEQTAGYMDRCGAEAGHLCGLRPRLGQALDGEDLAAGGTGPGRPDHHRLGHVSARPP